MSSSFYVGKEQKDILGSKSTTHKGTHGRPRRVDHTKAHTEAPTRGPVRTRLAVNSRRQTDELAVFTIPQLALKGRQTFLLFDSCRASAPQALLRTSGFVLGSNIYPLQVPEAQPNCLAFYIAVTTGHRSCCPVVQMSHLRFSEVKELAPRAKFQSQAAEPKA